MITRDELIEYAENERARRGHDPEDRPIFSIMLFENPDKEFLVRKNGVTVSSRFPDTGDQYTVGFCYDLDNAIKLLESNAYDIHEGCYDAAFILCQFSGLYPGAGNHARMYFVFDKSAGRYVQKEEPKIFKHVAY